MFTPPFCPTTILQPYFDKDGRYVGNKLRTMSLPRQHGKTFTFAERYGASDMTLFFDTPAQSTVSSDVADMMDRFPKQGKFMVVYKDKDDTPETLGWNDKLKVIPHTADQFCWVDGKLYEHNRERAEWDSTSLLDAARYVANEATPSSVVFLTMGDTVVFEEKTTVVERKG